MGNRFSDDKIAEVKASLSNNLVSNVKMDVLETRMLRGDVERKISELRRFAFSANRTASEAHFLYLETTHLQTRLASEIGRLKYREEKLKHLDDDQVAEDAYSEFHQLAALQRQLNTEQDELLRLIRSEPTS